ncbi:ABC transporter substrate-binding protein [Pyxidicoccus sp. MSG2]|uniref:ABC transporter substrate-binding protein n=1 Tax=Pyxidicoccus sp. MSG2 TaxID=2996790 RepID=UPI00226F1FDB|nr:ABC transporter substrate-binding protein [Pyxidicoccus sp. MSG2]MCY1019122.1 ABC transporter substrate-binding protein [Pyxidicoccus sp. MSG2]
MRLGVFALLLALGCDTSLSPEPPIPDPNRVHLGLLQAFGGPGGFDGFFAEKEARLALQEINAAGGVNGQELDLLLAATERGDPDPTAITRASANELADLGVVAVAGPPTSSDVLGMADLAVSRRLPIISSFATAAAISELNDDDFVWRMLPSDEFQGRVLADRIHRDGIDTVSILHTNTPYGVGLARTLRAAFEQAGGRVLAQVSFPEAKTTDFGGEVAAAFAQGDPPAIVLIASAFETAGISTALLERNPMPRPALYGGDASRDNALLGNAPPEIITGMRGTLPTAPRDNPSTLAHDMAYRSVLGEEPQRSLLPVYDTVYLIALALLQGGENTHEAVRAHLREVSRPDSSAPVSVGVGTEEFLKAARNVGGDLDFEGASGGIDFDAHGDVTRITYEIWEVVSGPEGLAFVRIEEVTLR